MSDIWRISALYAENLHPWRRLSVVSFLQWGSNPSGLSETISLACLIISSVWRAFFNTATDQLNLQQAADESDQMCNDPVWEGGEWIPGLEVICISLYRLLSPYSCSVSKTAH